jgi:O-antigen/teichoic acid export membrane protein
MSDASGLSGTGPGLGPTPGLTPSLPDAAGGDRDDGVAGAGAARNTLLGLAGQVATLICTGALTLYLVRALGVRQYGVYSLAVSVAGLLLLPAGMGLPLAIGRFLADHRGSSEQVRQILRLGVRLQVAVGLVVSAGLFLASGAIANAYGNPHLGWPLRWAALSVFGQAIFNLVASVGASLRRSGLGLSITVIESVAETGSAIALVAAGAGTAGATLGKFIGYTVAAAAGVYLTVRLVGRGRAGTGEPRLVGIRSLLRYAGAMFVVDVVWSAIVQLDVLLIAALLGSAAVGSFGAVGKLLVVAGYVGLAVSAGVAPRLSLADGNPDVRSFNEALRYLTIVQGLVIAPMVVWATPLVHLLLGSGYHQSAEIMRWLAPFYFIGGPASLITVAVTYLGEARRRVPLMLATLVFGLAITYVLLRLIGVVGAAIADDIVEVLYVGGHLWISSTLIDVDLRGLARCVVRTVAAAAAMAAVLFAVGTGDLSVAQWVVGIVGGSAAFIAALLVTRELTVGEIATVTQRLWVGMRSR